MLILTVLDEGVPAAQQSSKSMAGLVCAFGFLMMYPGVEKAIKHTLFCSGDCWEQS